MGSYSSTKLEERKGRIITIIIIIMIIMIIIIIIIIIIEMISCLLILNELYCQGTLAHTTS